MANIGLLIVKSFFLKIYYASINYNSFSISLFGNTYFFQHNHMVSPKKSKNAKSFLIKLYLIQKSTNAFVINLFLCVMVNKWVCCAILIKSYFLSFQQSFI